MDKSGEKPIRPEAAVKAKGKFIEVVLKMLFDQTMVGSQEKGLHIGNQDVHPAQSAAVLIKDLEMMVIPLAQRGPKRPKGVAVNPAAGTNCLLGNGWHPIWKPVF